MNEIENERMQESEANGEWAMLALRAHFDADSSADIKDINRAVYKQTACGAWVQINEKAELIFGSIVEGSDAEFVCDAIATERRWQTEISEDIAQALEWLEGETTAARGLE